MHLLTVGAKREQNEVLHIAMEDSMGLAYLRFDVRRNANLVTALVETPLDRVAG